MFNWLKDKVFLALEHRVRDFEADLKELRAEIKILETNQYSLRNAWNRMKGMQAAAPVPKKKVKKRDPMYDFYLTTIEAQRAQDLIAHQGQAVGGDDEETEEDLNEEDDEE